MAKIQNKTKTTVQEESTYGKIGVFLRKDQGKASIDMVTSVNEPLKVETSDEIQKIDEVTVKVHVFEDKGVHGNRVYQKTVLAEQYRENGEPAQTSTKTSTSADPKFNSFGGDSPMDKTDYLKNMHDNLHSQVQNLETWQKIGLILAVGALVVAGALVFKLF